MNDSAVSLLYVLEDNSVPDGGQCFCQSVFVSSCVKDSPILTCTEHVVCMRNILLLY